MEKYELIPLSSREVQVYRDKRPEWTQDNLAIEEPLEIRLGYFKNNAYKEQAISITMRSPGNDKELAIGFLFTEGIIQKFEDVVSIKSCGPKLGGAKWQNIIKVELSSNANLDLEKLKRHFYTTSSCGICGKSSIDAIRTIAPEKMNFTNSNESWKVQAGLIYQLPEKLADAQKAFTSTGGLHASGFFDLNGDLILLREDVGRHNALDKIIGSSLINNYQNLNELILLLSGRASFELIQKAAMANIQFIASIGAPSNLAVQLASEMNMTLIGFLKNNKFNIYTGSQRVI